MSYFLVNVGALPVAKAFYSILKSMPEESQDAKTKALQAKMMILNREVGNAGHFNTLVYLMRRLPFPVRLPNLSDRLLVGIGHTDFMRRGLHR